MNNKKFIEHIGIVAPINVSNIDTDIIIPKQFLQRIKRTGFGKYLFYNWRYMINQNNTPNFDFILNKNTFKNTSILLTRENFGCGSSREHALWSLTDYGIKVIISSSFADIFYNNAINNQLLPIILNKKEIEELFVIVLDNPGIKLHISLQELQVKVFDNLSYKFNMNNSDRNRMLHGIDNIKMTLKLFKEIEAWERKHYDFLL